MAKAKKETATEEVKPVEAAKAKDVAETKEPTLTATEEAARQVSAGKTEGKKYKLANPQTSFNDPNFTLANDQEKTLPDDPSPELVERIRAGFIIEAK